MRDLLEATARLVDQGICDESAGGLAGCAGDAGAQQWAICGVLDECAAVGVFPVVGVVTCAEDRRRGDVRGVDKIKTRSRSRCCSSGARAN